ncbi:MAG: cobyrinate a,c-diamide synthase [Dethiobacter sp.]|nr:MAG: cobyrinate a,c-diamide synthase [Dethiobacter sp.]
MLAGTHSGVGKTTISMGIMHVLTRFMHVQPYKVGPDYIDPAFHTHITGRHCRNLDGWLLEEDTLKYLFLKNGSLAEICVIEGVMGLYDGAGTGKDQGSTAHIAKILNVPVVLVLDGKGMAASAAAMVLGYQQYDPMVKIRGVIINNVKGENHYRLLKEAVERDTGVKVVGYLPANEEIRLPSRHLGLVPRGEIEELQQKLERLGDMVRATIDLQAFLRIAGEYTPPFGFSRPTPEKIAEVRLAVAYDQAFNFYYRDNLDLLEELGAELVFFSPMEEEKLPGNIDGLLLGGGFPEVFARELEANVALRKEIGARIPEELPVYGECGGLMYLSGGIVDNQGDFFAMTGAFPGTVKMTKRLQRFGYVEVELQSGNILGKKGERVRAHEFHHSLLVDEGGHEYSFRVKKIRDGEVTATWECGIKRMNMLASYPHLHFYANLSVPSSLVYKCREYKQRRSAEKR